jgi:lysosomal alpha-glucosidase
MKVRAASGKAKDLDIHIMYFGDDVLRVNIDDDSDGKSTRFKIPFTPNKVSNDTKKVEDFIKYSLVNEEFFLYIHSPNNLENVYYKIESKSFQFGPTYLELTSLVNTNKRIHGFGERVSPDFFLKEGIYTTWARDIPSPVEDGKWPGNNDYGTHPVFFTKANFKNKSDPSFYSVYNHNAGAQDVMIKYGDDFSTIQYRITGTGIFDLFLILENKTPEETTLKYHKLVGVPLMPPLWSFGWH